MHSEQQCTPSAEGALGITTKSSPTCEGQGESLAHKRRALRADRYRLQNVAAQLAQQKGNWLQRSGKLTYGDDYHRVCKCSRKRVKETADIHKSRKHGKAFYAGLAVCGSVWACPVCTAKIQERRREEIAQAINWAYANGKKAVLVTLTFPHYAFDSCADLLDKQAEALKLMRKGRSFDLFRKRIGEVGRIRSLEVMIGKNGWHPHTHELLFVDNSAAASHIEKFLRGQWESACKRVGLIPRGKVRAFRQHAIDVKDQVSCSDYLAKQDDSRHWGADREVAASSKKRGSGVHPFGLLDRVAQGDDQAGRLFLEYIEAFQGKRQIFWSPGFKKLVNVQEKSDEALAEEQVDNADVLAKLEQWAWDRIVAEDARALILELAEEGGLTAVLDWLGQFGLTDAGYQVQGYTFKPVVCLDASLRTDGTRRGDRVAFSP